MGYIINYQSKKYDKKRSRMRFLVLLILCFSAFLVLVETRWQHGSEWLRSAIDSHYEFVAVSAWDDFAEELRYGKSLDCAFSDFFRALIQ